MSLSAEANIQQPEGNTIPPTATGKPELTRRLPVMSLKMKNSGEGQNFKAPLAKTIFRRFPAGQLQRLHAQSRAGNSLGRSPPETTPEPTGRIADEAPDAIGACPMSCTAAR